MPKFRKNQHRAKTEKPVGALQRFNFERNRSETYKEVSGTGKSLYDRLKALNDNMVILDENLAMLYERVSAIERRLDAKSEADGHACS